jgi:hypothetical protein
MKQKSYEMLRTTKEKSLPFLVPILQCDVLMMRGA